MYSIKGKSMSENLKKIINGKTDDLDTAKVLSSLITHTLIEFKSYEKEQLPEVSTNLLLPELTEQLHQLIMGEISPQTVNKFLVENYSTYLGVLMEATYKKLKAKTQNEDPKRAQLSSKLRTKIYRS